jgi:hypothetical protein
MPVISRREAIFSEKHEPIKKYLELRSPAFIGVIGKWVLCFDFSNSEGIVAK